MYKILDTNILLLDAYNITTLGKDGSIIVLPEIVLDEIDSKKTLLSEIGFQAREVGRLLTKADHFGVTHTDNTTITKLKLDGIEIQIIAFSKYDIEMSFDRKIINDRKIIAAAKYYHDAYSKVTFITNDVMCRIRASSLGIEVRDLRQVEDTDIHFTRSLTLTEEDFRTAHNKVITDLDPNYAPNYFNYVLEHEYTKQIKLATISNGRLQVIGKDTETDLRKQDINPANSEQLFFTKALQDPTIHINLCEARAGSGKTAVAISNGIRMVRKGYYDKLIYIRASIDDVDKGEEIGFLSGNDEKLEVYLYPLEDTLDYIIRNRHKNSKLKGYELDQKVETEIEDLKNQCNIQAMIGLGMRGRTFHNAYVIIDEAQNQSKASLQKMLTRFGQGCKVVVIGSQAQIDNPYITKYTNGLSVLLEACKEIHEDVNLHAVNLPKVLRGPIAEFTENLFIKKGK